MQTWHGKSVCQFFIEINLNFVRLRRRRVSCTNELCARHRGVTMSVFQWNATPGCVPCRGVPDGPLTGNGDLGLILGGAPHGRFAPPPYSSHITTTPAASPSGALGLYLGKGDLWGFPNAVTYHGSFQHFSPGFVLLALSGTDKPLTTFEANQSTATAHLYARVGTPSARWDLSVDATVAVDPNLVVANLIGRCPAGETSVSVDVALGTDNTWTLPVAFTERKPISCDGDAKGMPVLTKSSVHDAGLHSATLVPCDTNALVYNSVRRFERTSDGQLSIASDLSLGRSPRPPQCLAARDGGVCASASSNGSCVVTMACDEITPGATSSATLVNGSLEIWTTMRATCVSVIERNVSAKCPPLSYYTTPSATGACQSSKYEVIVSPGGRSSACSQEWSFDPATGFLRSAVAAANKDERCLAAVPRSASNNVAIAVRLTDPRSKKEIPVVTVHAAEVPRAIGNLSANVISAIRRITLPCNRTVSLTIAVVSERDLSPSSASSLPKLRAAAAHNAALDVAPLEPIRQQWWSDYYSRSSMSLPGRPELQRFIDAMLYLQRGSMRVGKTLPGLWGCFSTTDFSGWSDQLTLDYNVEGNFWAAAGLNHPELVTLYNDWIFGSRLIPIAEARASLRDWSGGGWPDVIGAEVSGSSCGPTLDWDHDYGCASQFGGFQGLAFVSMAGPFESMEGSFDDGTRFVAGLVATPMLKYYDATLNASFLTTRLLPYLRKVASFYTSYMRKIVRSNDTASAAVFDLPWTCAQEICSGGGPLGEHNNHQDIAYARMAYSRLLALTDNHTSTASERRTWHSRLTALVPFPTVLTSPPSSPQSFVFAEAENVGGSIAAGNATPPSSSNNEYPIVKLAAIHPAGLIDRFDPSTAATELELAKRTSELVNAATRFSPGNGFVLSWPSAAILATPDDAAALLDNFTKAFVRIARPNGWPDSGGGGLEQIGALSALQMMLVRVVSGVLRLFPGMPKDEPCSFEQLRVRGAFLISARQRKGGNVDGLLIDSDVGERLLLPSASALCVNGSEPLPVANATPACPSRCFELLTVAGGRYSIAHC